jgi:hypothetical protein
LGERLPPCTRRSSFWMETTQTDGRRDAGTYSSDRRGHRHGSRQVGRRGAADGGQRVTVSYGVSAADRSTMLAVIHSVQTVARHCGQGVDSLTDEEILGWISDQIERRRLKSRGGRARIRCREPIENPYSEGVRHKTRLPTIFSRQCRRSLE